MQAARGTSLNHSDPPTPAAHPGPEPRRRFIALFATVAALAYAFDVATKVVAVDRLSGDPTPILGDFLSLSLARNPGAAFSTGTSYTIALSCIAITAVVVVIWIARRLGSTGWSIGLGFLLGGVLGNLTDRIFRTPGPMEGHVVDFLMLPNFPVFNFADIWINVAAATIIIQSLRGIRVDGLRHVDEPRKPAGT